MSKTYFSLAFFFRNNDKTKDKAIQDYFRKACFTLLIVEFVRISVNKQGEVYYSEMLVLCQRWSQPWYVTGLVILYFRINQFHNYNKIKLNVSRRFCWQENINMTQYSWNNYNWWINMKFWDWLKLLIWGYSKWNFLVSLIFF